MPLKLHEIYFHENLQGEKQSSEILLGQQFSPGLKPQLQSIQSLLDVDPAISTLLRSYKDFIFLLNVFFYCGKVT